MKSASVEVKDEFKWGCLNLKKKIENLNKFPMISLSSPYVYKE